MQLGCKDGGRRRPYTTTSGSPSTKITDATITLTKPIERNGWRPAGVHANPMTYMYEGRQYLAVAVGRGRTGEGIVALTPETSR